jgi:hypothetical protein
VVLARSVDEVKPTVSRTFTTTAAPDAVFDYLADFTNAEEWDPGTKTCQRVSGDGGVGTTYRNVSSFLGRESEITYRTAELERPTRIHLTGHNEQFDGHDVLGIRAHGDGSEVTYTAEFAFKGSARLAAPVVAAYLPFLARKTVHQLRACLDRLPSAP